MQKKELVCSLTRNYFRIDASDKNNLGLSTVSIKLGVEGKSQRIKHTNTNINIPAYNKRKKKSDMSALV